MNGNILVSIIIPVYKSEDYIDGCLASVLNQSYKNLEIILVDDGSPDNCPQICDEYSKKDARVAVIHQKNKGVSAARNAGIDYSHGDYVTFVDSDDELCPNAIELLLDNAIAYDVDISSGVKCIVNADGKTVEKYSDNACVVYEGLDTVRLSLSDDRRTNSSKGKLIKKDFLGDIRFVEGRSINEDIFFVFQCFAQQPKMVQHNICVYKYFTRNDSASRNSFSEKYLDMLYFWDRKKEIIEEKFPELKDETIYIEVTTHLFFLETLCRTADKKYKKYERESIKTVREKYRGFVSIHEHERKMAWIVAHGMFPLYKKLFQLKYGKRK